MADAKARRRKVKVILANGRWEYLSIEDAEELRAAIGRAIADARDESGGYTIADWLETSFSTVHAEINADGTLIVTCPPDVADRVTQTVHADDGSDYEHAFEVVELRFERANGEEDD